jgi:hypothetical protein
MKKLTLEKVKEFFKENNCELLENEYINNRTPMKYKCECGDFAIIRFDNFKGGKRCNTCRYKKSGDSNRLSYKLVYDFFKKHNCELLSKEYKDAHHLLDYRCQCGNVSKICYGNFQQGQRCKECGLDKMRDAQKHSYEYIKSYFKENHCELLETEYQNNRALLKYKCSCGNKNEISFDHFQQGQRCIKCAVDKRKLSNMEIYGVEHVSQNKEIQEKMMNTFLQNYGVSNPMQNSVISEKSFRNAQQYKEYKFQSGNVIKIQGYENFAIDILLKTYTESQLKFGRSEVPSIWYEHVGKTKRYFADIYVPKDNLIIEVKSIWTYTKDLTKTYVKLYTQEDWGITLKYG